MEITGILMRKLGEREGVSTRNGNPWKIGEYLVEIPGQYPRHINFRVSDGQVGRLARFESMIGKTVTVSFDIDAHEHEGRWYNEINAWGIMEYVVGRKTPQTTVAPEPQGTAAAAPTTEQSQEGGGNGLPF
jgi:hypothetical protein